MKFRARKTLRFGPLRFHFTQRGFSSWGWKIGPWTHNVTSGRHTIDTPGPGALHSRGRRRSRP